MRGVPQGEPPPHVHVSTSSTSPVSPTIKPPPHVHASTSSTSPVCTAIARLQHTTQEVLLDSGSSISSISADLVTRLQLPTSHAPPIKILFGDQQRVYHSHTQVMCMLTISSAQIHHRFYVLPRQLFPITLGCDWFLHSRACLDFSSQQLILPNHLPIALFTSPRDTTHISNTQYLISPAERIIDIRRLLATFPSLSTPPAKPPSVRFPIHHTIPTGNARPINAAPRRRSPLDHERIDNAVKTMLQQGIITPSKSEWISEPHMVKKGDGSYRFCVDFRQLNHVTTHDRYPLPRIDDLLDQLGKSKYFTSLDLASGYWQIPMNPQDAHKTAFRTRKGIFQFTRMPFGLSDAGSTFQRMANAIFDDLITRRVVIVYLDDILVHTSTWAEHLQVLREVLTCVQRYRLQLQWKKCRWGSTCLRFLGYVISSDGIQMDPEKTEAVQKFPRPTTVKQLQRFLGLLTFSLRFIPRLADLSAPLRALLQKDAPFLWTEACESSFLQLKRTLQASDLLAHPDFTKPFHLQTDASNVGLGAVLLQSDDNDQLRPIAYISRSLTKAEQNYSTTEKEFLAIVWAFHRFHPYLHGSNTSVETDHQPLLSLIKKAHPPGRLLRWALALQDYTFTLRYRHGSQNIVADGLSRISFQANQIASNTIDFPISSSQMANMQQHDKKIQDICHRLRAEPTSSLTKQFMIQDNVLLFCQVGKEPRVYVPEQLRLSYLRFFHDHPLSGHLGFHKVLDKIRCKFYWPGLRHEVASYIKACNLCQAIKSPQVAQGLLHPIQVQAPFEVVGWDIMGPFPESQEGNKFILVITEYLTRWAETAAIPDAKAMTIASKLLDKIIFPHGCPLQILSDRGPQFNSELLRLVSTQLGIQQLFTSPYHPQTNGLTERLNRTLKQQISAYIDPLHSTWDRILPFVTHAYNTTVQASTRISPFRALYGRDPRLPPEVAVPQPTTRLHADAVSWWSHLQQLQPLLRKAITSNLHQAQLRQKRQHDVGRADHQYHVGDKVLVYFPICRRGLSESLMHRWIGPFEVQKQIRDTTYLLRRASNNRSTFAHQSRMKPFHELPPPPLMPTPTPTPTPTPVSSPRLQPSSITAQ